jgi:type I restriction enzyme S subunit
VPWLNSGSVNQGSVREASEFITNAALKNSSAKWIRRGSLVLALAGQGKTKGMVAQLDIDATCNQSMAAIVPFPRLRARYLFWWLTSNYRDIRNMAGGDLRDGLNLELLGNIECPLPAEAEQTQIAEFLDYETAKIDALIDKQRQLIALLNEKRQAVISHAVTKGLNPDAPLRDSGIEWLGKVPAHWQEMNLNRVVARFVDYRGRTPEKTDEGRPLVTAGAVRDGKIEFDRAPQFVSEETYKLLRQRGVPEPGDVLFTSEAPLGEVAIVDNPEFACAQRIIMFKLDRTRMHPAFLWLYLRSTCGRNEILSRASGSTAEGIRADRLRACRVLVPPLAEQREIADHVASMTAFELVLVKAAQQTDLLQERRAALISAAVTGKIDVRNWNAPDMHPEAAGEAEVA